MLLPIANVGRIMKQILPPTAKISKEAKETMQECVSEFISFVTSEASVKCQKERRKTVTSEDICWAMNALGFDDYGGLLRRYVERYREFEEGGRANQERAQDEDGPSWQDLRRTDNDEAEASGRRSSGIDRSNI